MYRLFDFVCVESNGLFDALIYINFQISTPCLVVVSQRTSLYVRV
jgi:hypothetical protein